MGPSQKIVVFGSFCFFQVFFKTAPPLQKKEHKVWSDEGRSLGRCDHILYMYIYMHNHIDVFAQNIGA
jgi:hypothetical protein